MIPRLKPFIGWNEIRAALSSTSQDAVLLFEEAFADKMDQKHALAFPYGRTGLVLLLQTLGLKNKEIICPAYTCVVVAHAIVHSGNIPVFIDCEPGSFNMNLDTVEMTITEKTGAIIATSIFGYPVDLDRLDDIKKNYPDISIIQDCAHSFAAQWNARPVQKEGIASLFGLNISKIVTSIFGGMITTDDTELFNKLRTFRDKKLKKANWRKNLNNLLYLFAVYPSFWGPIYGVVNALERSGLLDTFVRYYDEGIIDMPSDCYVAMSSVEARVGRANIERYNDCIEKRIGAAHYYFDNIESHPAFKLPPKIQGATYSHFVVLVKDRSHWLEKALKRNVQFGRLIEYNIPEMKAYGSHSPKGFPIAALYARSAINLPVWGGDTLAQKIINICFD